MILIGIAPPTVTGLDWTAGLPVIFDLDPRDGLSFPSQRSSALVTPDVGEGDRLAREVTQEHDVVVVLDVGVGNPDAIRHIHSASPSAQVFQTHGQETMEPFADVREVFEKYANSQGG